MAICKYGSTENGAQLSLYKKLNLSATSKYPHLLVQADDASSSSSSDVIVKFDKVLLGQTATKTFTLINMTEVKTNYFVERSSTDVPPFDTCFNCLQHMGVLQPYEKVKIPVSRRKKNYY